MPALRASRDRALEQTRLCKKRPPELAPQQDETTRLPASCLRHLMREAFESSAPLVSSTIRGQVALAQCVEVRQNIVYVFVGIRAQQLDVSFERIRYGSLHLTAGPRPIPSRGINEPNRELIAVCQFPTYPLARGKCHGNTRTRSRGLSSTSALLVQHPLQKL